MTIHRHPSFKKAFKKRIFLDRKLVAKTKSRIEMFMNNHHHPLLRDHALTGSFRGLRSFSVTGDVRVVYRLVDEDSAELLDIGTHNQVYR